MIHQYWSGPDRPAPMERAQQWSPATVPPEWLRLVEQTSHLVVPVDHRRHEANVIRLHLLYTHGGMWADYDLRFIGPITELPSPATASHQPGVRCNCWMAFPAGHPALLQALTAITELVGTAAAPQRSPNVSGEALLSGLWGPEVAEVPLYEDINGRINETAPRLLAHRGTSASVVF